MRWMNIQGIKSRPGGNINSKGGFHTRIFWRLFTKACDTITFYKFSINDILSWFNIIFSFNKNPFNHSYIIFRHINICPTRCNKNSLFIILQVHSTCFECQQHSSSGVHKIQPPVLVIFFVQLTPDDECCWHPKHVEWTCRIINILLRVAFRWTIINIDQRCTEP